MNMSTKSSQWIEKKIPVLDDKHPGTSQAEAHLNDVRFLSTKLLCSWDTYDVLQIDDINFETTFMATKELAES